jgi:hypothetical protein
VESRNIEAVVTSHRYAASRLRRIVTIPALLRSPTGASTALLLAALDQLFVMVANVPLVIEYEAICSSAEHQMVAGMTKTVSGYSGCIG